MTPDEEIVDFGFQLGCRFQAEFRDVPMTAVHMQFSESYPWTLGFKKEKS